MVTQVRPLRQHNHSRHLPQTRHRRIVTACSHHRPDAAYPLGHDQISLPFDANRRLIEACTEVTHRGHLKGMAFLQDRPHGPTATMAPLSLAVSHSRQQHSPTSHWAFQANGFMRRVRQSGNPLEAFRHGQIANQLALLSLLNRKTDRSTMCWVGDVADIEHLRNDDER